MNKLNILYGLNLLLRLSELRLLGIFLRKLKGKDIVDNAALMSNDATIAPEMYKLDLVILAHTVKNNRKLMNTTLSILWNKLLFLGSNEKNKVEVQYRKVNSKLNKQNSDSKNVCNKHIKHPIKGAHALCSVCNECLFDANHAMCLIDHVNSMNMHAKSASTETYKRGKRNGNLLEKCLYSVKPATRRPKVTKSAQHRKPKISKSMTANRMEPDTYQGSDTSVAPSSSSLIHCRLSKLFYGIWTIDAPST
ncbi:hypothetical protein Tco_0969557 [Tanacetum coccineum]